MKYYLLVLFLFLAAVPLKGSKPSFNLLNYSIFFNFQPWLYYIKKNGKAEKQTQLHQLKIKD